jgi:tetratricopeptide (TPR) repeat protein
MLGRLAEAEEELAQMLALGRKLEHSPSLAAALGFALYAEACECSRTGVTERMAELAGELAGLAADDDFFLWHALATTCGAIVALDRGQAPDVGSLLAGLELWERAGARLTLVMINVFCAEALARAGLDAEAHRRLDAAEVEAARGEGPMAPEIPRIRGRLLARAGDAAGAEAQFRAALERARAQGAAFLELRAALDLADLLAATGRTAEAVDPLADSLARCPEGLDRPDPTRAAALVAELRQPH